eukprot:m.138534 g.138534  ORF g.138534 m.138534 type:complete len:52 (+) comp22731_c0_seq1:2470-2625(+)
MAGWSLTMSSTPPPAIAPPIISLVDKRASYHWLRTKLDRVHWKMLQIQIQG